MLLYVCVCMVTLFFVCMYVCMNMCMYGDDETLLGGGAGVRGQGGHGVNILRVISIVHPAA
jgi:hypothetical protein